MYRIYDHLNNVGLDKKAQGLEPELCFTREKDPGKAAFEAVQAIDLEFSPTAVEHRLFKGPEIFSLHMSYNGLRVIVTGEVGDLPKLLEELKDYLK